MQVFKRTTQFLGWEDKEKAFLTLDKASTEYRDLRLLESISMSPVDTDKRLAELGCVRLADFEVSNVTCFLYVPKTPWDSTEGIADVLCCCLLSSFVPRLSRSTSLVTQRGQSPLASALAARGCLKSVTISSLRCFSEYS